MCTRPGRARIVNSLAIGARETLGAAAQVLVGRRVLAGATVPARLVSATVVEVLVAQNAAPVGVARTVPRGTVTVAVFAARVGLALRAQLAAPAGSARALAGPVAAPVHGVAALLTHGCG